MVVPAIAVLIAVVLYPVGYAGWMSLHDWNPLRMGAQPFIGLDNYARMLLDPTVKIAVLNTLEYVVIAVLLEVAAGLGLALALHNNFRGVGLIRTVVMIPLFVVPVVIGIMWRLLLNQDYGPIYFLFHSAGLVGPKDFGLSNSGWAIPIVAMVSLWQIMPFVFLIFLAGLQSIPREQYEAANIDGATTMQEFFHITLPWLRPLILFVLLFRVMESFKVFDLVMVLTGGGPGTATEVANLYIYRQAFQYSSLGYAAALALAMLVVIFAISVAMIKAFRIDRNV
jgi:multiple sugar transport system permease protein